MNLGIKYMDPEIFLITAIDANGDEFGMEVADCWAGCNVYRPYFKEWPKIRTELKSMGWEK